MSALLSMDRDSRIWACTEKDDGIYSESSNQSWGSSVLNMCSFNAVSVEDAAGNIKLEKRKATGRIDGIQAFGMAIGASLKEPEEVKKEPVMFFV